MSVQIEKNITTVQVEIPKTNVAIETAITEITVQTSQPEIIIATAGVQGPTGPRGFDTGTSGTSGTSGVTGTSGTSGIGSNGTSGTSGSNGITGAGGTAGSSGTSGLNGTFFGSSGTSGVSGSGGTSGTSGVSGSSGTSGVSGSSGSSALWNFLGPYQVADYNVGDVVTYDGQTWYCIQFAQIGAGPYGGYIDVKWTLIAAAGSSGTSGVSGENGSSGTSGVGGGNIDSGSFATTGSNQFNGNQTITGSLTVSSSGTFTNIGPANFIGKQTITGSLNITDSVNINSPEPNPLSIGDSFGGGKLAYILTPTDAGYDSTLIKGIVAATADESTTKTWTNAITASNDKVANGYDDWYLPSKDELNKLYLNKDAIGGFVGASYWSSTQSTSTNAWFQLFAAGGTQLASSKTLSNSVRAIRAFSIPKSALNIIGNTTITGSLNISGGLVFSDATIQTTAFVSTTYTTTSSLNLLTESLNSKTGSYATTGSNTFIGNQTISGSLFTSGSVYVSGGLDIKNNGYSWSFDSNGKTRIPNITFNSDRGTGMVGIKPVAGREFQIETSTAVSSAGPWVFGLDGTLSAPNGANILRVGNLATTGSNQFKGNQTITGSLIHGLEGNIATGEQSHAEGSITQAIGNYSHAEGDSTQAIGDYSHAEGQETIASGSYSHAEGYQTIALGQRQHVTGQYNFVSPVQSAFIVGNGIDDGDNRSNLLYAAENAVEITGSLNVSSSFTASLREGYVWVGDNTGKNTLQIATSSFGVGGGAGTSGTSGVSGTSGTSGQNGQSNTFFNYQAKTNTTTGGPGSGHIIWNNATQASATSISVSEIDQNGNNDDIFLGNIPSGSIIVLQDQASHTNYQRWTVGTGVDNTTYWTFPITLITSTYSFTNNQDMLFIISQLPQGTSGTAGTSGTSGTSGDITLFNAFTGSVNTYTSSNDSVRNRILQTTASLNTYTGSNDSVVQRLMQATASINITTGSLLRIYQTTASLNTYTGSSIGIDNGLMTYTASLKAAAIVSSSTQVSNYFVFAQTSSANTFYNNQTISGSLFVSSIAISNATLLASSSNLTLSSGSNLYIYNGGFADISGSLRLTGSLSVGFSAGTSELQVLSTGVTIGNISTDRHLITGSLIVSASTNLTGSVTINESRIDTAWTSYTPTWVGTSSNPAIGNGTISGAYKVIGKTCFVRGRIAMGSTTTYGVGDWKIGLPVAAINAYAIQIPASLLDSGNGWYTGLMNGSRGLSTTYSEIQVNESSANTAVGISSIFPFTWGSSDELSFNGSYEIA